MRTENIKLLFRVGGAYDAILGFIFLVSFTPIYNSLNITLPNHAAYVQFAACLVIIFGIGFWFVAQDPIRNRDIIKMGILLKITYSSIVLFHQAFGTMPSVWVPFAWIDILFLILFVNALISINRETSSAVTKSSI
jgi:hypothetical protein